MSANSKIEWTHHTFNPWWGCVRVSPACQHCYAEAFAKRVGQNVWGVTAPRRFFGDKHWAEPLKWNAAAQKTGERHRVFCASMADVFEDRSDLDGSRARLWRLIEDTPNLDWLLLTKRPECISRMVPNEWLDTPRPHVWYGTTVEDRARQHRIYQLRDTPAAVRFLSCEPLLEALELDWPVLYKIHWVICGGESGPGARPMHPQWALDLRDACEEYGVKFHFKQWGDWFPRSEWEGNPELLLPDDSDLRHESAALIHLDDETFHRVGKKAAGRVLDCREWNEYPRIEASA